MSSFWGYIYTAKFGDKSLKHTTVSNIFVSLVQKMALAFLLSVSQFYSALWTGNSSTSSRGNGSFRSYSRSDPGSFRSYSLSVRSFRPDFRGGSFRPNFGGSFRPTLFYIGFLGNRNFSSYPD